MGASKEQKHEEIEKEEVSNLGTPSATLFENFFERHKPHYMSIDFILSRIKKDYHKEQITKVREANKKYQNMVLQFPDLADITEKYENATGKNKRNLSKELTTIRSRYPSVIEAKKDYEKLKNQLMNILFSGKFTKRYDESIIEHSGYIILDFDKVTNPETFRDEVFVLHKFVRAAFISPSGKGVKVLVRVPRKIKDHRGYFQGLKNQFPDVDPSGINESRICYVSYDPDLKSRSEQETDIFKEWIMPEKQDSEIKIQNSGKQIQTNWSVIQRVAGIVRSATEGNRNSTLLRAAKLAGGYLKEVREEDALAILIAEGKDIFGAEFGEEEMRTIRRGIEYGRNVPIYELEAELSVDENTNHIVSITDVYESLTKQLKYGIEPGSPLYIHEIDRQKMWSRKPGRVAVYCAPPEYGKSEFIKQIYLLQAIHEGVKSIIYSPEETEEEFYTTFLHTLLGKRPEIKSGNISIKMFEAAISFLKEHIFYLKPDAKNTQEVVFANFTYFCRNYENVRNVCIDPLTKITYASDKRDDKLLGEIYSKAGLFAHEFNVNFDFGIHPRPMKIDEKTGEYPPAHIYDIAGGGATANFLHDIIVLDRPEKNKNPNSPLVTLYFRKIKDKKTIGYGTNVDLIFNSFTNRYSSSNKEYVSNWNKLLENTQINLFEEYKESTSSLLYNTGRNAEVVDYSNARKEQDIEVKDISVKQSGGTDYIADFEAAAKPQISLPFEPEDEIPF